MVALLFVVVVFVRQKRRMVERGRSDAGNVVYNNDDVLSFALLLASN